MTLDRVYNYIINHDQNTLVFVAKNKVCCTQVNSKLAPTVINNKSGEYQVIGVYTPKASMKFIEDDLLACGFWE